MDALTHFPSLFLLYRHTLDPTSSGRIHGLKRSTRLSPAHASRLGLANWVRTPTSRQISSNRLSRPVLIYSRPHVFFYEKQIPRKNNNASVIELTYSSPQEGQLGHFNLHYLGAAAVRKKKKKKAHPSAPS